MNNIICNFKTRKCSEKLKPIHYIYGRAGCSWIVLHRLVVVSRRDILSCRNMIKNIQREKKNLLQKKRITKVMM